MSITSVVIKVKKTLRPGPWISVETGRIATGLIFFHADRAADLLFLSIFIEHTKPIRHEP